MVSIPYRKKRAHLVLPNEKQEKTYPKGKSAPHLVLPNENQELLQLMTRLFRPMAICTIPQASDEEIFQAVRRLVAAEIQAITFREYLPATLGGTQHIPAYQGYNESIDVAMSNMMSTAAFR